MITFISIVNLPPIAYCLSPGRNVHGELEALQGATVVDQADTSGPIDLTKTINPMSLSGELLLFDVRSSITSIQLTQLIQSVYLYDPSVTCAHAAYKHPF